jgi:hypothetical protein
MSAFSGSAAAGLSRHEYVKQHGTPILFRPDAIDKGFDRPEFPN